MLSDRLLLGCDVTDYAELFDKILKEKGLSDRKASKETGKAGYDVAPSYINQIRNGKSPPPSDDVSRVIAKICGKSEELLVFQKYYDQAPQSFRDTIENIRGTLVFVLIIMTASKDNEEQKKIIVNELEELPIAELIARCSDIDIDEGRQILNQMSQADILNAIRKYYPVQDDAMHPTIHKNDIVYTWAFDDWAEYKDGDIFCYHKHGDETFYVREIQFKNDDHTIFQTRPMNSSYPKETFHKNDVFLYGKVTGAYTAFN